MLQFLRNFLHVWLVVVFDDLDVGRSGRRLKSVCWNVVLIVCDEGEWDGWAQGGCVGEEQARVLYD